MFIRNGNRFNIYAAQVIDDFQYPAGYFVDPAARAAHGITEIPDPERKDTKFYFVQETNEAPYVINTPKSLDQVKDMIWADIKSHRDNLQAGGYQVAGNWYHSDEKSKIQQLALVIAGANLPPSLQWKTMDGTMVAMNQTLAAQIFQAAVTHETTVFAVAESHRASINALQTVEQIAAYDWSTGWPAIYEPAEVVEE
jgi:hypothetical protein